MNISDLLARNAEPAAVTPDTHWLQLLLIGPRAAAMPATRGAGLHTVVAKRPEQFAAAQDLVRRRYAWRGYRVAPPGDRDCAVPSTDERVTLLAEGEGKLLGTLTIRTDSPRGLLAEGTYGAAIGNLRREGRRIGELTKLAVEEGADWRSALDALVQRSWLITRIVHALTDVVIEVNPRHVRFYERVFGFIVAATGGVCGRVGAPSALLQLDLEQFGCRVRQAPTA